MAQSYLEQFGKPKEAFKLEPGSPIEVILNNFAKKMAEKAKQNTPTGSGSLANSIQPVVKLEGTKATVDFLANDYWDYVNSGVDGYEQSAGAITNQFGSTYSFAQVSKGATSSTTSFKDSIEKWIQSKGIIADDGDYDSLQFIIMRSIKQKGIAPTQFMNKTFTDEAVSQFENEIAQAVINLL
jgi:hypothetical protein